LITVLGRFILNVKSEIMNSFRILPNYTYEDYLNWEGSWEIIDGIAYAMSPMPSTAHQKIANEISYLFLHEIKKNSSYKCRVFQPIDLKVNNNTILNPDISIICEPTEKQFVDFPPILISELLSPSTALKDKNTKFDIYESFGVKYYLIVDPIMEFFELFKLNSKGKYELCEANYTDFDFGEDCIVSVDLTKMFN